MSYPFSFAPGRWQSRPGMLKKIRPLLFLLFLFTSSTVFSQNRTVTGNVRDSVGIGLAGITIAVKGTSVATSTTTTGSFSIQVPQDRNTLVFSGVGYSAVEVSLNGQSSLDVRMVSTAAELETVVVAYGVQKKATLSGSIASVRGSELVKSPAINVSNSLAGRVSGLTVVGQGGEPGNDASFITIRGINTFGNTSPLYVIDGIPLQGSDKLQRIDPMVIESITVLKDASAAIYGSQGANGVILITTKRGKAGQLNVSANFNQGFSQPTQLPDLLSSYEIAVLQNEALDGDPAFPTPPFHTGRYTVYELAGYLRNDDPWKYPSTDWQGAVLKDWALQNYVNVSLSGGSEKLRGLLSMSARHQDGFFKNSSGKYNQYDLRGNMDFTPNKYITFSVDINTRLDKPEFPIMDAGRIFHQTNTAPPFRVAYWPDGTIGQSTDPTGQSGSPVAISTPLGGYNKSENYVINSTGKLNIKLPWVEGLSVSTTGTIDRVMQYGKYWSIPVRYNDWDTSSPTTNPVFIPSLQGDLNRTLTESQVRSNNYLFNFLVNYEKAFGDHQIKLLYGYEEYERATSSLSLTRRGFDGDNLDQMQFGSNIDEAVVQTNPGALRWKNFLGRVNYDFNSKIMAEFVFRYQGSSIFHEDHRWGFFPGGSVAYRISEENFWKNNIGFIDAFKIRGSYGTTGNDLVPPFQYLALYQRGGNPNYVNAQLQHIATLQESISAYEEATWETAKQLDIGFDAEFLDSKLSVTVDYFKNTRENILTERSGGLPASTGIRPPKENIGEFLNKGFDFNIAYRSTAGQLNYQFRVNGLYAKNKIVYWDEPAGVPEWQMTTGHPLGAGLYFHAIGIYGSPDDIAKHPVGLNGATPVLGDIIFEDVNSDGAIDNLDRKRLYKNDVPVFSGGLTVDLSYKNFDFTILFQGATGSVRYQRPTFSLGGNYLQSFYDKRWTPENPNGGYPRMHSSSSAYWSDPTGIHNTFFVKKTDYARLKNFELGYTLPGSLTKKASIERVRLYVSALNVITYAPDLKDWDTDPEQAMRGQFFGESYPLQRVINLGINVGF